MNTMNRTNEILVVAVRTTNIRCCRRRRLIWKSHGDDIDDIRKSRERERE